MHPANRGAPGRELQATACARPCSPLPVPTSPHALALGWAAQVLPRSGLKINWEQVGAPMPGSLPWVPGSDLALV